MPALKKWFDKSLLKVGDGENELSLFALTFPIFMGQVSSHLNAIVQTAMCSRYAGGLFVIPVSIVGSVFNVLNQVAALVAIGVAIVLSIYLGRKDHETCKKIAGTAVISSLALTLLVTVLGLLFAQPLLLFMGMSKPDYSMYMPYALEYYYYRVGSMVLTALGGVFFKILCCYGHTKQTFWCGLIISLINAAATALVIFVFQVPQEHGIMALGLIVVGCATLNALLGFISLKIKKVPIEWKFTGKWCKKIFAVGSPASVSSISYNLSQMVTAMICTMLTPAAYLAKNYVGQLVFFVYVLGFALGQANAIMIGRLCGMGDLEKADLLHRQNLRLALAFNILMSVLFALFAKPLVQLIFGAEEQVGQYAAIVLWIDVLVESGRAMNHLGENGLNATGDVRFTTVISIISCWACSVGLSFVFVLCGLDLYGIWLAFAIDELFRGTLYYVRWRKKSWQKNHLQGGI